MKHVEVKNVGVMNIFVKNYPGQFVFGKTPLLAINAIFTYFAILK